MEYTFKISEEMQDLIDMSITLEDKKKTYGELVNNLFRQRYYERDVEAINNNYLDDMTNERYIQEREEMKQYRKACKDYAKELLGLN